MITTVDHITTTRAAALFVSTLSTSDNPSTTEIVGAIERSLRTHGGSAGCAADVAQAYGDHPELAAPRMRWARRLVELVFPEPPGYALAG